MKSKCAPRLPETRLLGIGFGAAIGLLVCAALAFYAYYEGERIGSLIAVVLGEAAIVVIGLIVVVLLLVRRRAFAGISLLCVFVLSHVVWGDYVRKSYRAGALRAASKPGFIEDLRKWIYSPENDVDRDLRPSDLPPFLFEWLGRQTSNVRYIKIYRYRDESRFIEMGSIGIAFDAGSVGGLDIRMGASLFICDR